MKKAIEVKTFEAKIWMGLMEGYTGPVHNILEAQEICMNYVNDVKLCVTLSPTKFIYVDGTPDKEDNVGVDNGERYGRDAGDRARVRPAPARAGIPVSRFRQVRRCGHTHRNLEVHNRRDRDAACGKSISRVNILNT